MPHSLFKKKSIAQATSAAEHGLARRLSGMDLTLLGIGAIIGAGIFVLTGVAAATKAGPALWLSFVVGAFACGFAALVYAEFASSTWRRDSSNVALHLVTALRRIALVPLSIEITPP